MMMMTMLFYIVLSFLISGLRCQDIERVVVPEGQPFAFDCLPDESVYFGRRLNEWSEIQEDNENYLYLNLNFNYLNKENILRVSSDSAQSKHAGFYACRKPTWASTSMSSIYQLIIADVQSFYWNFVCHGPIGSCQRSDNLNDEDLSQFEVADQTNVELFCCASVTGYKNVNIHMNQVGENRANVEVNKKQELDGSWVICANQRTTFRRTYYQNQQILTCELLTDGRSYSTLSSVIKIKDVILPDNPSIGFPLYPEENQEDQRGTSLARRSRRKLTTGKKIGIILGSILGGLLLLGLAILLVVCIQRHKKDSPSSKMSHSKQYSSVDRFGAKSKNEKIDQDVEHIYEEPIPLSKTAPVFMRC